MGQLTMSNIPDEDVRFITHILFTYVYSFCFYLYLLWMFFGFIDTRSIYVGQNQVKSYTVMLRRIPKILRNKEQIRKWFENNVHISVVSVNVVWKAKKIDRLKAQLATYRRYLEEAEELWSERNQSRGPTSTKKGPWTKIKKYLFCGFLYSDNTGRPLTRDGPLQLFGPKVSNSAHTTFYNLL